MQQSGFINECDWNTRASGKINSRNFTAHNEHTGRLYIKAAQSYLCTIALIASKWRYLSKSGVASNITLRIMRRRQQAFRGSARCQSHRSLRHSSMTHFQPVKGYGDGGASILRGLVTRELLARLGVRLHSSPEHAQHVPWLDGLPRASGLIPTTGHGASSEPAATMHCTVAERCTASIII
jgi:hypothetical protein